jgi:hypothetical protein
MAEYKPRRVEYSSRIQYKQALNNSGPGSYRFVEHLALRAVSRAPNLIVANRSVAPVKAR